MMRLWVCLAFGALAEDVQANPMQRIIQLLNDLKDQVEKDGEAEKLMYQKFMCWCDSGGAEEEEALQVQKERIERLHPLIAQAKEQVETLTEQIHETDKEVAGHEQAKAGADAIRADESEKYKAESENLKQSIVALTKAIAVLTKARDAASFAQVSSFLKDALRPFSQHAIVRTVLDDRQVQSLLTAPVVNGFLQVQGTAQFAPDHILGVLSGLMDAFKHDLQGADSTEAAASAAYDSLVSSKEKELRASRATLRKLNEEKAALNAQLARDSDDIAATQVSYAQDQQAYEARKKQCETKTKEFHDRQQSRLEEMLAINEAVSVLSADDVHVVMQKTATKAPLSFLQLQTADLKSGGSETPHDVLVYVQELAKANPEKPMLNQLAMKLATMSGGSFDRVIQVIKKQIEIVDMEQASDDKKYKWCKSETDKNAQSIKMKGDQIEDLRAQIGNLDADLHLLKDEATTISKEIDELDRLLDDAARQRADEASAFDQHVAELKAAQQALVKAIQVMEGFYGQQALLQAQAQAVAAARGQDQNGVSYYEGAEPAPETPSGEYKGAAGGKNILKLLAELGEDLVKEEEMQRKDEETAKTAFGQLQAQTGTNRKLKSDQRLMRKEQIARLTQQQDGFISDLDSATTLLSELKARELDLAKNCFIVPMYDRRKSLRGGDREAMEKAISILS
jgi:DNA repair exonuclease SbcCD ATPase subunit